MILPLWVFAYKSSKNKSVKKISITMQALFITIIAIISAEFLLERYLEYLNLQNLKTDLPEELTDIYDAEKYKKSIDYERVTSKFSLISSSFNFLLILLMLFLGGFAALDTWARNISEQPVWLALSFFGMLFLASSLISIPFSAYSTFVIEEKFGFNKTTPKTFVLDILKSWLFTLLLGGLIMGLIVWFYTLTTTFFWLYAWGMVSLFSIFMMMFYSNLIVPLFNKQTPLEAGDLRDAILDFSQKVGFKLDNIFIIDGSKRSTKSNAYFSGLGSKKRIVLYDTLINDLNTNELVGVLAHEIGHYKLKHSLSSLVISILQTGLMLYIMSLFVSMPVFSEVLGASQSGFHLAIITFGIVYSPLSTILGLLMNQISQKNEYAADKFAKTHFDAEALASALKKLSVNNLSNLTPHPLYVFFHYSHPTLLQRLKALKA